MKIKDFENRIEDEIKALEKFRRDSVARMQQAVDLGVKHKLDLREMSAIMHDAAKRIDEYGKDKS